MKYDLLFSIALMFVFASCKTEEEVVPVPDYIGTWFGSSVAVPDSPFDYVDARITCKEDGTYETLLYNVGGSTLQNMSSRGTYACSNGIFYSVMTEVYDQVSGWVDYYDPYACSYSISGNTLTMQQDFNQDGTVDTVWTLSRQ